VGRRSLDISADIEPGLIPQETGARLVLLAAEALLHAWHASAGPLAFRLTTRFEDDSLVMAWAPSPDAAAQSGDRVAFDLIHGYARQLRGRLEEGPTQGFLQVRAPLPRPEPEAANDTAPLATPQGPKFFRILDRTERGVAS
jgi:hypothetical protein